MFIRTTLAVGLFAAAVPAQGVNCALLGQLDPQSNYNDIWGYAAPNGDEYALVGSQDGTSIIDVTDPANPVERAFIPGATSVWRDIRTFGPYAYVVTEAAAGMQVIDLTNPNSPTLIGVSGAQDFGNAHNIALDTGTGWIYISGAGGGAGNPVYDAAANPTDPPLIGNLLPANPNNPNSTYFHDIQVENGFAYGSMIYNGDLRIMDVSVLPGIELSNSPTPGNFTHQAWPNASASVMVTCDEISGGVLQLFDITNKNNPIPMGQYTPNGESIPHNAFVVGSYAHVSWYTAGYRCIDISDPANPVEVASYDTWSGSNSGFEGAWGCYPFLPSGNVIVSDRSTGLYIVRPNLEGVQIVHDSLADTVDEDNDYEILANVTSTTSLQSVSLTYRIGQGSEVTVPMTPTGSPDQFGASIPAQEAPINIYYRIDGIDTQVTISSPRTGEHRFLVGTLVEVFKDDAEGDRGWTSGFTSNEDDWQRDVPSGASGSSGGQAWSDPPFAFSGDRVFGNDLGGPGFNGSYANNTSNWLESPVLPTYGRQAMKLRYRRWISLGSGDAGNVLVNGQLVATVPAGTRDTEWQWIEHDISSITDSVTTAQIRFELVTNGTVVGGGWNLDDIELYVESDCTPAELYGEGGYGAAFITPGISIDRPLQLGGNALVYGQGVVGGATCIHAMGFAPTNQTLAGAEILVDPALSTFAFAVASGAAGTPGVGVVTFPVTVPNIPALDGIDVFHQVVAFDAASEGGIFSATSGMRTRTCRL